MPRLGRHATPERLGTPTGRDAAREASRELSTEEFFGSWGLGFRVRGLSGFGGLGFRIAGFGWGGLGCRARIPQPYVVAFQKPGPCVGSLIECCPDLLVPAGWPRNPDTPPFGLQES